MKVIYSENYSDFNINYESEQLYINTRRTNQKISQTTEINRKHHKDHKKCSESKYVNKMGRRKNNSIKQWKQTRYNLRSRKK